MHTITASSLRTAFAAPRSIGALALLFLFAVVELLLRVVAGCGAAEDGFRGVGVGGLASEGFIGRRCGGWFVGLGGRGERGGALAFEVSRAARGEGQ